MSWKKALLVNYRFSYFRPFTYDVITQNTTHSKISIFIGVIPQGRHLGRRKQYTKKATKKTQKGERAVKKVISLTQIPPCTFSYNSIFTSWFLMKFR